MGGKKKRNEALYLHRAMAFCYCINEEDDTINFEEKGAGRT